MPSREGNRSCGRLRHVYAGLPRERCVSNETRTNTTKPSGIVTMAGWLKGTMALPGARL